MSKIKIIINPLAGRGTGARIAPLIAEQMRALNADFDIVHTTRSGEAIELARAAAVEGYATIVAVGGDGTSHEVANGLMLATILDHRPATLGCIPAGNGNNFAVMNGATKDLPLACKSIVRGATHTVDLGKVTLDGQLTRYFSNAVGVGFDALVTIETYRHRHLRGMALYLPVVLKTIFSTLHPMRLTLVCDGQELQQTVLMAIVCNGPREGSTFLVAPNARCDDGLLDLLLVDNMPPFSMLFLVPSFMQGTHLKDRRVSTRRVRQVVIASPDPLYVHVDGEILCPLAHRLEIEVCPACLQMITPQREA